MNLSIFILLLLLGSGILLTSLLVMRPSITRELSGKVLALISIVAFPSLSFFAGSAEHLERSKKTEFCLSCHVMADYGTSLLVDDKNYIPANHFQNNHVPKDKACYTCHTDYAMFGDFNSKLRGLRHLYVQYVGTIPDTLRLYSSYNNRECLYCHQGSRTFEENVVHADSTIRLSLQSNELSCLSGGCHGTVHNVRGLQQERKWKGAVR